MDCQVQDLTEVMLDIAPVNTGTDIVLQAGTEDIEPPVNTSANLVLAPEMAGNESHDNAANVLPPEMLVNDFPDKTKANDILPSDITMHVTSVNADTNTVFLQPLEFKEGVVQKVCDLCGASFKKKPYLNRHLKKVHGGKKVANPLNVTVSFDEAKSHDTIEVDHTDLEEEGTTNEKYQVDNTHNDVDFKSTISDTQQDIMMDTSGLMENPKDGITISSSTVETKRAKCAICQSSFKKSLYLRRHIKVKHPHLKQQESNVEGTSIYPVDAKLNEKDADGLVINKHFCEICPRSFKRRAYLRQHMKKFHMAQRSKDGNSCNQTLNKAMPGKLAEKHDTHSDGKQAKRAVSSNILPLNLGTNEEIATGPISNENLVINTGVCVKEEFPISLDTNKEQGTCSAQEGNIFQLGVQFDCVDGSIHRNIEIIDNGNTKVSGKSAVIEGCTLGDMFVQVKDIIGDVTLKPENITFELKGKGMTLKVKY